MSGHHGLLLWHADTKYPNGLVHHHLSDLRGSSAIPQPSVHQSAGSCFNEDCGYQHVRSGILVSDLSSTDES